MYKFHGQLHCLTISSIPAEGYSYGTRTRAPVVLPSVSRAARGGLAVDDESIPRRPPYIAHISNLPYDVDESAIAEVFEGLKVSQKVDFFILSCIGLC